MNILLSNDDGVNARGIYVAYQALKDIADVTIVAPTENNSSIGHKLTLFKHLQLKKTLIEDDIEAYSLSGSPADCVTVGIDYVMDNVDLVVCGINHGVNISRDITTSGTVCAAFEAVSMGIPALAVSLYSDPKKAFKQDANGEWHMNFDFTLAGEVLGEVVQNIINNGFPDGVDLLNLNIPAYYESKKVKITSLSPKMLNKRVIDKNDEDMAQIFNYSLDDLDDDLVMITSKLNEDYEKGSDGYCLMVEKRPSLTPLTRDMNCQILDSWLD